MEKDSKEFYDIQSIRTECSQHNLVTVQLIGSIGIWPC